MICQFGTIHSSVISTVKPIAAPDEFETVSSPGASSERTIHLGIVLPPTWKPIYNVTKAVAQEGDSFFLSPEFWMLWNKAAVGS